MLGDEVLYQPTPAAPASASEARKLAHAWAANVLASRLATSRRDGDTVRFIIPTADGGVTLEAEMAEAVWRAMNDLAAEHNILSR